MKLVECDVAIVGGGIMGCATAVHLRRKSPSKRVVLIERRRCGQEASGVNFGNVRCHGRPHVQLPLAIHARGIWASIETLIGTTGEYERTGALKIAFTEAQTADLDAYIRDASGYDLRLELLGRTALRARHPWLSATVAGARWSPDDGHANSRLVAAAFGHAAPEAGVILLEGHEVAEVSHDGRRFVVEAPGLRVRAEVLVNASGAWGNRIAAAFDGAVPMASRGPQMGVTEAVPAFVRESVSFVDSPIYFKQTRRGTVVFGGGPRGIGDAESGRHFVFPINTARQAQMLGTVAPHLRGVLVIRGWSGIEGYVEDDMPVISPSPRIGGLFHAFGFCGSGFHLGPGVGDVVADLVLGRSPAVDLAPYRIDRFDLEAPHG